MHCNLCYRVLESAKVCPSFCKKTVCAACFQDSAQCCKLCDIPRGLEPDIGLLFSIAIDAIIYTNFVIVQSPTRIEATKIFSPLYETALSCSKHHQTVLRKSDFSYTKETYDSIEMFIKGAVKFSEKYSIGNCLEFSLMAFEYIRNFHRNISIDFCRVYPGDHGFLILSIPRFMNTPYVICDPWGKIKCTLAEAPQKFRDYNNGSLFLYDARFQVIQHHILSSNKGLLLSYNAKSGEICSDPQKKRVFRKKYHWENPLQIKL